MQPIFAILLAALGWGWANVEAKAQAYPSRPITIVVPFPAGGPSDTLARILGEHMRGSLGQPIVVENVAGASGSIGVGRVARAAPDGYTLILGSWVTHVVNGAVYTLKYDVLNDFAPVALIAHQPAADRRQEAVPANDLKELIAWLKANPDKATQGTTGRRQRAARRRRLLPEGDGHPPSVRALSRRRAGHAGPGGGPDRHDDRRRGQLAAAGARPATSRPTPSPPSSAWRPRPTIPTVDEAGLPGLYVSIWHALWAPKGTPKDVIGKLNAAVVERAGRSGVRQRLADLGQEIPPREQQTPEALGAYHKAEIEKWWPIIKAAGIKAE